MPSYKEVRESYYTQFKELVITGICEIRVYIDSNGDTCYDYDIISTDYRHDLPTHTHLVNWLYYKFTYSDQINFENLCLGGSKLRLQFTLDHGQLSYQVVERLESLEYPIEKGILMWHNTHRKDNLPTDIEGTYTLSLWLPYMENENETS